MKPEQLRNPYWRITNLYTITNKDGDKVRFKPNEPQQELLRDCHDRNLVLKARQRGVTTLWCIVFLDDCIWNPNVRAAVIAHKLDGGLSL